MEFAEKGLENIENKEGALLQLREILEAEFRDVQSEYEMHRYDREMRGYGREADDANGLPSSGSHIGQGMLECLERIKELHDLLRFVESEEKKFGLDESAGDSRDYFVSRVSGEVPGFVVPKPQEFDPDQKQDAIARLKSFFEVRRQNDQQHLDFWREESKTFERSVTLEGGVNKENSNDVERNRRYFREETSKYQNKVDEAGKALNAVSLLR